MLHRFAAGGISGSIGIAIANPIERVKVILQDSTGPRESAIAVARRVMAKEGLPGFWAGLRANVARTFLVCAAEQVLACLPSASSSLPPPFYELGRASSGVMAWKREEARTRAVKSIACTRAC